MCGIAGIFAKTWTNGELTSMVSAQGHRGPDGTGIFIDPARQVGLGHNRLSIIDLTEAGSQPMTSSCGNYEVVLNGEIYNYLELRRELESGYRFSSRSDTEVLLAAYEKWGEGCLDRLLGMFAFIIWDKTNATAFAARDRFGVKPLYYHSRAGGTLLIASEIKALHATGVPRIANGKVWATYLTYGLYDHSSDTFWKGISSLPGGHYLTWKAGHTRIEKWYDLADRVSNEFDRRSDKEVQMEYFSLMKDSVALRFRSDVPVGINLSGGLDSSSLLGLVHEVQGKDSDVKAFTFATGDPNYDELPWVAQMLSKTNHELVDCRLSPEDVPAIAMSVQHHQDEPFGGLPTLAYAKLFEKAKEHGVTVLLDGNGMDEQWAGYDYYQYATNGHQPGIIQGTKEKPVRPECLDPAFRDLAEPLEFPDVFPDKIRNLQYRDSKFTKIPRAMRFNDRISMRSSRELREPFLDHRLFELAMRQPGERKIVDGRRKKMLRDIAKGLLPEGLSEAPKRPMQTPQREWLRGPLREWASAKIDAALNGTNEAFFDKAAVKREWSRFCRGEGDNSFYIWQWISSGMIDGAAQASESLFDRRV